MNQHVTLTYEERARANAKAIRDRLYGKPKVVNVIREVLAPKPVEKKSGKILEAEPIEHVKAYRLWRDCSFKRTTMNDYAEELCQQKGTTLEAIRYMRRFRALTHVLDYVVFEVKAMFPHKSLSEIGRMVNREHTSIVRSMERESLRRGVKPQEMTSSEFPDLPKLLEEGRTLKEIGEIYEVGISKLSRKVHAMGLGHLLKTRTKPMSMEFIESVRAEYEAGYTLDFISKKYGISVRSITNWRNTFGWPERGKGKAGIDE